MKETITRILCDICGNEVEKHASLSQFQHEWAAPITIDTHTDSYVIKDTCIACNSAICELIFSRKP